jgi:hypothetical protein
MVWSSRRRSSSVCVIEGDGGGGFDAAALGLAVETLAAGGDDLGEGEGKRWAGLALEVVADACGWDVVHPLARRGVVELGEGGGELALVVLGEGGVEGIGCW